MVKMGGDNFCTCLIRIYLFLGDAREYDEGLYFLFYQGEINIFSNTTQCLSDVILTSMRRHDVAPMLRRRPFHFVFLVG